MNAKNVSIFYACSEWLDYSALLLLFDAHDALCFFALIINIGANSAHCSDGWDELSLLVASTREYVPRFFNVAVLWLEM